MSDSENRAPLAREFLRRLRSDRGARHPWETLSSSLALAASDRAIRSLLVCSSQPREGKTTVATHLALHLALSGERVVLVDADLRRPQLHRLFELSNDRGFADLLEGRAAIAEIGHRIDLGADASASLRVVPSGAGDPAAFQALGTSKLRALVASLLADCDRVIFDTPPALAVSDALFLAPAVDGVVFVVGADAVPAADARLAKERIAKADGHLLGFVMNRFDETEHGPGYHPYHDYYAT
jgi:capsular exopolysaccharide synthesis family protein